MSNWTEQNQQAMELARSGPPRNWYALRVDSQRIPKLIDLLPQTGIRAFAPAEQRTRRIRAGGRQRAVQTWQPIMSGYLIAGFLGPPNWYVTLQTHGINGVVMRDGLPAVIPLSAMARCFDIHEAEVTALPGAKALRPGDLIRITDGAWRGHETKLLDISDVSCGFIIELFGKRFEVRQPLETVEAA